MIISLAKMQKYVYTCLKAALERQKSAKSNKRLRGSATNLIKEKINEELEMVESTFQAQKSLENLMQERADLTKEFTDVKVPHFS